MRGFEKIFNCVIMNTNFDKNQMSLMILEPIFEEFEQFNAERLSGNLWKTDRRWFNEAKIVIGAWYDGLNDELSDSEKRERALPR